MTIYNDGLNNPEISFRNKGEFEECAYLLALGLEYAESQNLAQFLIFKKPHEWQRFVLDMYKEIMGGMKE